MPLYVYLASAAVVTSMFLLWWSVAAERVPKAASRLAEGAVGRLRQTGDDASAIESANLRTIELSRSAQERVVDPLMEGLARRARRLTPVGLIEALEHRIVLAGATARWPVEKALAVKLALGIGGVVVGLFLFATDPSGVRLLFLVALGAVGYFGLDFFFNQRGQERQKQIQLELPDVLDQLTVSVEAGLAFEAALAQAGRSGKGPLSEELIRTLQDIQIGLPRTQALEKLLDRTEVDDLQHFVIAVKQAEQYGVAIADVLRVQSKEMREKRRQRAEERAMKIPVKIVFPTVFCILPVVMIIALGPGIIQIWDQFINR